MPATLTARPMPQRPANGLLAWEAIIGYLRQQYHLDASLTMKAVSETNNLIWSAYAVWGQNSEQVTDKLTMVAALRDLWGVIDRKHVIFESREAMIRRPSNYGDQEWLDGTTQHVFNQMLDLLSLAFSGLWTLTIVYEPVEMADVRFQVRATADKNTVLLGQAATLQGACRDLLRATAQTHIKRRTGQWPVVSDTES